MRQLDEIANQRRLDEAAAALRAELSAWHVIQHNPNLSWTMSAPALNHETLDLLVRGFRELVAGFDDAEDKWGGDYTRNRTRRDIRKAAPAVELRDALAECPQVKAFAEEVVGTAEADQMERIAKARFIAHNLTGSVITRAIETAIAIGIRVPRVERGFV